MERPKGWTIIHNPKPIPIRKFDWDFYHDDYDGGSSPSTIGLYGNASSYEDAVRQILDLESENE